MTIFARTRRLISSTIHDWLQRLENPEQLAKHSLRELAAAIETCTTATAQSIAGERMLAQRSQALERELQDLDRTIHDVIAAENETTARQALGRKFDVQQSRDSLAEQLAEAESTNQTLRDQLGQMRQRYEQAKRHIEQRSARTVTANARVRVAESTHPFAVDSSSNLDLALEELERTTLASEAKAELQLAASPTAVSQRQAFVEQELRKRS